MSTLSVPISLPLQSGGLSAGKPAIRFEQKGGPLEVHLTARCVKSFWEIRIAEFQLSIKGRLAKSCLLLSRPAHSCLAEAFFISELRPKAARKGSFLQHQETAMLVRRRSRGVMSCRPCLAADSTSMGVSRPAPRRKRYVRPHSDSSCAASRSTPEELFPLWFRILSVANGRGTSQQAGSDDIAVPHRLGNETQWKLLK